MFNLPIEHPRSLVKYGVLVYISVLVTAKVTPPTRHYPSGDHDNAFQPVSPAGRICPPNYDMVSEGNMPLPGGRECVEMTRDVCYLNYGIWICSLPMTEPKTRYQCCCSMGLAWGTPCEPCPIPGTSEYIALCGVPPGQIINPMTSQSEGIDACQLMPTVCTHGVCVNTPGSFECQCNRGFIQDINSHQCIDENECLRQPNPCEGNAQCVNLQGSFECRCPEGYKHGSSFMDCVDVDECVEEPNICNNGECTNLQGSFLCI